MDYAIIADAYEKIEATTKRLEMTDLLVELLKKTPINIIARVVYLTQGKLYPDFMGIEMGVAEKLAIKALARASGQSESSARPTSATHPVQSFWKLFLFPVECPLTADDRYLHPAVQCIRIRYRSA